jgi:type IV pilus assembly protein PilC
VVLKGGRRAWFGSGGREKSTESTGGHVDFSPRFRLSFALRASRSGGDGVHWAAVAGDLKARGFLYSELAKFARAGFGIDKACESIIGQPGADRTARGICRGLVEGLSSGRSLANSLRHSRYPVSELEVAMVDAAERGGNLETGFQHLAQYFRQEEAARRRIRRAMIYPVFLLHFALLVGIGITALLRQVNPSAAEGVGRATVVSGVIWLGIGYAAAIVIWIGWKWLSRAAESSAVADDLLQRVPLAGPVRRARGLGRFCEVLHLFLLSGQRMDMAWQKAGDASQSGQLRRFAGRTAPRLAAGESVGNVVADAGSALPGDMVRGFASADQTGSLDLEAESWAGYFQDRSVEAVERLTEWAPKIFGWAVMLFTGAMIIMAAKTYGDLIQGFLDMVP